jgi:hypothetical protein
MTTGRLAASVAVLLLCAFASSGEEEPAVKIDGKLTVEEHRIAVLSVKDPPADAVVIWDYDEEKLHVIKEGGRLYITGPPGQYQMRCHVVSRTKEGKSITATLKFTLGITYSKGNSSKDRKRE